MQKTLIIIILIALPLVFGTAGFCAESASAELCYGNLLALHNKYEMAVEHFDKAIGLDPNLVQAYSHRAAVLVEMGKYKKALKDCSKSMDFDPKNITYMYLGDVYKQLGDRDKERENMLAANKLLPAGQRKRIQPSTNNGGPIEFNYDPNTGSSVKLHGLSE